MKRMNQQSTIRATSEANLYLKELKNRRVFDRLVDVYLFAAAYAIKSNLEISPIVSRDRQDLIIINQIGDDIVLALEAGVHAVRKHNNQAEPADEKEVLDLVTQYAEAGLTILRQRWNDKTEGLILKDIQNIISSSN
jgi:hypothetical protein